jgi:hypothetical protein
MMVGDVVRIGFPDECGVIAKGESEIARSEPFARPCRIVSRHGVEGPADARLQRNVRSGGLTLVEIVKYWFYGVSGL